MKSPRDETGRAREGFRVVYAAPADLRGTSAHNVHIVRMCEALASNGLDVKLVVRNAPSFRRLAEEFGLSQAFEILCTHSPAARFGTLHFAWRAWLATQRADLVVTRNLKVAFVAALAGRQTVLELHSPVESRLEKAMLTTALHSPALEGLVVVTHALERRFEETFGPSIARFLRVLPDAAKPRPPADTSQTTQGAPVAGYVGSFLPGKGVDLIVDVAQLVPEVRFVLVGGTAEDAGLKSGETPPNIEFVGRLSHSDAMERVEGFDVVLLPNQRRVLVSGGTVDIGSWTSPLKLFEYMAAGKPILASRLPVLQEVLAHGNNCLLANPERPDEWATHLRLLIEDPSLARRLGTAARRQLEAHFTWTQRAQTILQLFD